MSGVRSELRKRYITSTEQLSAPVWLPSGSTRSRSDGSDDRNAQEFIRWHTIRSVSGVNAAAPLNEPCGVTYRILTLQRAKVHPWRTGKLVVGSSVFVRVCVC